MKLKNTTKLLNCVICYMFVFTTKKSEKVIHVYNFPIDNGPTISGYFNFETNQGFPFKILNSFYNFQEFEFIRQWYAHYKTQQFICNKPSAYYKDHNDKMCALFSSHHEAKAQVSFINPTSTLVLIKLLPNLICMIIGLMCFRNVSG